VPAGDVAELLLARGPAGGLLLYGSALLRRRFRGMGCRAGAEDYSE
tara:strand:- start:10518 stop:10655 length:138 start_codon:yes stop_codon:yes gene_type:complete